MRAPSLHAHPLRLNVSSDLYVFLERDCKPDNLFSQIIGKCRILLLSGYQFVSINRIVWRGL